MPVEYRPYRPRFTDRFCAHCGRFFRPLTTLVERGLGVYCSRACAGAAKRKVYVEKRCPQCGARFMVPPSHAPKRVYCSRSCNRLAHPVPRKDVPLTCVVCGVTFMVEPYRATVAQYCSRNCHATVKVIRLNAGRLVTPEALLDRLFAAITVGAPGDCWPRTHRHIQIGSGEEARHRVATRALYEAVYEVCVLPWVKVCHQCDNPPCHNPGHLFLDTAQGNVLDMWAKGRQGPPRPRDTQGRFVKRHG